jgi:hypothetical protein
VEETHLALVSVYATHAPFPHPRIERTTLPRASRDSSGLADLDGQSGWGWPPRLTPPWNARERKGCKDKCVEDAACGRDGHCNGHGKPRQPQRWSSALAETQLRRRLRRVVLPPVTVDAIPLALAPPRSLDRRTPPRHVAVRAVPVVCWWEAPAITRPVQRRAAKRDVDVGGVATRSRRWAPRRPPLASHRMRPEARAAPGGRGRRRNSKGGVHCGAAHRAAIAWGPGVPQHPSPVAKPMGHPAGASVCLFTARAARYAPGHPLRRHAHACLLSCRSAFHGWRLNAWTPGGFCGSASHSKAGRQAGFSHPRLAISVARTVLPVLHSGAPQSSPTAVPPGGAHASRWWHH